MTTTTTVPGSGHGVDDGRSSPPPRKDDEGHQGRGESEGGDDRGAPASESAAAVAQQQQEESVEADNDINAPDILRPESFASSDEATSSASGGELGKAPSADVASGSAAESEVVVLEEEGEQEQEQKQDDEKSAELAAIESKCPPQDRSKDKEKEKPVVAVAVVEEAEQEQVDGVAAPQLEPADAKPASVDAATELAKEQEVPREPSEPAGPGPMAAPLGVSSAPSPPPAEIKGQPQQEHLQGKENQKVVNAAAVEDDTTSSHGDSHLASGAFINHGLAMWEKSRWQWLHHHGKVGIADVDAGTAARDTTMVGGKLASPQPQQQASDAQPQQQQQATPLDVDDIIDIIFASPRQLRDQGGPRCFLQSVPLPQMIDILVDLWYVSLRDDRSRLQSCILLY